MLLQKWLKFPVHSHMTHYAFMTYVFSGASKDVIARPELKFTHFSVIMLTFIALYGNIRPMILFSFC